MNEYQSHLSEAEWLRVILDSELMILKVTISMSRSHRQTGLPKSFQGFGVQITYEPCSGSGDYAESMLPVFSAYKPSRDPEGIIDAFHEEYRQEVGCLEGAISYRIVELPGEAGKKALFVIVSDWQHAKDLERRLQSEFRSAYPGMECPMGAGIFRGVEVSILRDIYQPCHAPYVDTW